MRQTATVKRLTGDGRAEIEVVRRSACGGDCSSCGGCTAISPRMTVSAVNKPGADVGDTVTVETQSSRVLGLAALLYLVPVALFFAAYFTAAGPLGDTGAALCGAGAFLLGILCAVLYSRRMTKNAPVVFMITSILTPEEAARES